MDFAFLESWHAFLPREGGHVIGLMGSGGKTSLLRVLALHYATLGVPVILTTTTRSEPLAEFEVIDLTAGDASAGGDWPEQVFVHAGWTAEGKWQGLATAAVDELSGSFADRIILVEVDGAAKHPLKLHRAGEPCWPQRTSLAVVVMGCMALGEKAAEILFRCDAAPDSPLADLGAVDPWEWDHFWRLLKDPGGYLAQVPGEIPALLALTGISTVTDSIGLFDFVARAMAESRLPLVMFCDLAKTPVSIRTACRQEGGAM